MTLEQRINILCASAGIPKPVKVSQTKKHLSLIWNGDQSMNGAVIVNLLQQADVNYPDPRANTVDTSFIVEAATASTVRTVLTMDRLDQKGYNAILDTATDKDGDGVKELESASDEEEIKDSISRKKEAEKHID